MTMAPSDLALPPGVAPSGVVVFAAAVDVRPEDLSHLVPHANNVQYLRWIDRVTELHLDSTGETRATMASEGRMWFVARHEIDYLAEVFVGERLGIATWIAESGRTTVQRATAIWIATSGVIICKASSRMVHVNLVSRRPCRPPVVGKKSVADPAVQPKDDP